MEAIQEQPRSKAQYIHEIFTVIAPKYDRINTLLSFNRDKYWRRFAAQRCGLHPGDHVLDVCCGSAMLTLELAKYVGASGSVTGLDFCENMLATAQNNLAGSVYKPLVKLIHGSALDLPFEDGAFDAAATAFGLRNVENMDRMISELVRVVKPGGTVLSLDLGKPRLPIFKSLYFLYFNYAVPFLGRLGVGIDGLYNQLPISWRSFPDQAAIAHRLTAAGLVDVAYYDLTGGIVTVHIGKKPLNSEARLAQGAWALG
jgi:demethylmenaquinone methyltransferase/2-methoxy-6-polyprenyl-1,4-benzoquinol methylase